MRKFQPYNTLKQFFEVISLQSHIQKNESFTPANKHSQIQLFQFSIDTQKGI